MAYVNTIERHALAKGRMTTLESTLRKLIKLKFGEPPAWADEKIKQANADQLDDWTGSILTADTLEAVFAH